MILSLGYEKTGPGRRILAAAGGVAGRPHRVGRLLGLQPVGVILLFATPSFATGPGPIYSGSGYLPARDFWRMGTIVGMISLVMFLAVGVPWLLRIE